MRLPFKNQGPDEFGEDPDGLAAEEILEGRRLGRWLDRLSPEYRHLTLDLFRALLPSVRAMLPKLKRVRSRGDLGVVFQDSELLVALEAQLFPIVERAIQSASRGTLPLRRRYSSHALVSLTGLAGPLAANATEVQGLVAMAIPPVGAADLAVSVPSDFNWIWFSAGRVLLRTVSGSYKAQGGRNIGSCKHSKRC